MTRDRKTRTRGALVYALLALPLLWGGPLAAQQPQSERLWAEYFGEGMRAWASGEYDAALDALYKAHALKPTSKNLALIVRAHDFLGECDASARQLDEYAQQYPGESAPPLQRCARTAKVHLTCGEGGAPGRILIDARPRGACGDTLTLPAGSARVSAPEQGYDRQLELRAGERYEVTLEGKQEGGKGRRPQVPRLINGAERYSVFLTPDGLYQIWVLNDYPDLLPPYEGSVCSRKERSGEPECRPLTPQQRDELEKVAPLILLP